MAKMFRKIASFFGYHRKLTEEEQAAIAPGARADDIVFDNVEDAIAFLHKSAGIA